MTHKSERANSAKHLEAFEDTSLKWHALSKECQYYLSVKTLCLKDDNETCLKAPGFEKKGKRGGDLLDSHYLLSSSLLETEKAVVPWFAKEGYIYINSDYVECDIHLPRVKIKNKNKTMGKMKNWHGTWWRTAQEYSTIVNKYFTLIPANLKRHGDAYVWENRKRAKAFSSYAIASSNRTTLT